MPRRTAVVTASLLFYVTSALAGIPTYEECQQGGEFIRNAALARDAGMTRQAFLERMAQDFVLIRALPQELRWFVKDAADEAFFLAAAAEVFDRPQRPAHHESDFLSACGERALSGPEAEEDRGEIQGHAGIER